MGKIPVFLYLYEKAALNSPILRYIFTRMLLFKGDFISQRLFYRTQAASVKAKQNNTKARFPPFLHKWLHRIHKFPEIQTNSFSRCRLQTQVAHAAMSRPSNEDSVSSRDKKRTITCANIFTVLPVLLLAFIYIYIFFVFLKDLTAECDCVSDCDK